MWTDKRDDHGPVRHHRRRAWLRRRAGALLAGSAMRVAGRRGAWRAYVTAPHGRKPVFLGDLVDRGPEHAGRAAHRHGCAGGRARLCVQGNHDRKFVALARGPQGTIAHGLQESIDQLRSGESPASRRASQRFLDDLRSHLLARRRPARGRARRPEGGDDRARLRRGARFRPLSARPPARPTSSACRCALDWAANYRGETTVVYGHTPVAGSRVGQQHALHRHRLRVRRQADGAALAGARARQVPAAQRLLRAGAPAGARDRRRASAQADGRRPARHGRRQRPALDRHHACAAAIVMAEENAAAALEVMSRFAIAPQWLVYLPPTMSPSETSAQRRLAGASGRGLRLLPRARRSARSCCRGKAHGLARRARRCAATPTSRGGGSASRPARAGAIWTRTGRALLPRPRR